MTIAWLLESDDLPLPARYAGLVDQVFRLRSTGKPSVLSTLLSWVSDWDLRRARAAASGNDCVEIEVDSLGELLSATEASTVWICSATLQRAVELKRLATGCVFWLSSDGEGATSRWRGHQSWKASASTTRVALAEVDCEGRLRPVSARECRLHRTSPAISQLDALIAGRATVGVLAAGWTEQACSGCSDDCHPQARALRMRTIGSFNRAGIGFRIVMRTLLGRLLVPPNAVDHWHIGVAAAADSMDVAGGSVVPPASAFHWVPAPDDRFLADPMLSEVAGKPTLFYEQLLFSERRTSLKAVELASDGSTRGPPVVVLERPFHLSFPGVFEDPAQPEKLFMLPEQASSGQTVLYSSAKPTSLEQLKFEEDTVLLDDLPGIDPVLQRVSSSWFLFVSDGRDGNSDNNLQLFVSEDLRGPYRLHPMSPIRLGLRGSRMAGRLVRDGDHLIRPAQDCAPRYGAAIVFFIIDELTASTYRETEVTSVGPDDIAPGTLGVHTYSRLGPYVAMDRLQLKSG